MSLSWLVLVAPSQNSGDMHAWLPTVLLKTVGGHSNDMCQDILQNSASSQVDFCHNFGIAKHGL